VHTLISIADAATSAMSPLTCSVCQPRRAKPEARGVRCSSTPSAADPHHAHVVMHATLGVVGACVRFARHTTSLTCRRPNLRCLKAKHCKLCTTRNIISLLSAHGDGTRPAHALPLSFDSCEPGCWVSICDAYNALRTRTCPAICLIVRRMLHKLARRFVLPSRIDHREVHKQRCSVLTSPSIPL
jgi:hypothetical protein